MNNRFFMLPDADRRAVIEQTAIKTGLPVQAIEKDLWVTALLQILFSMPIAEHLIFKGGTSLSKVWRVIERFSEDIDLAVDRKLFGVNDELTIRQIKNLRKQSSLFVKTELCGALRAKIEECGLSAFCEVEAEPDGVGDRTYPEPRRIFVRYQTLFDNLTYLRSEVVLEIGSRSLIEPTASRVVQSIVSENLPIDTDIAKVEITTAVAEKTFLEKVFLLHELFAGEAERSADRRSRHLYDLERMMDADFAIAAVSDDELWQAIHNHRALFTRVSGVDYSTDIRPALTLIPPYDIIADWRRDYGAMQSSMIFGEALPFDALLQRIKVLEQRFRGGSALKRYMLT